MGWEALEGWSVGGLEGWIGTKNNIASHQLPITSHRTVSA
jgi:hypothetical protein